MGALTHKRFSFELRQWEIEYQKNFDPTDGFASPTRIYISKNQIIHIEPYYNNQNNFTNWLNDKGRHFFDGIFNVPYLRSTSNIIKPTSFVNIIKSLIETLYIFDHCNKHKNKKSYFTIIFDNLSLEALSILDLVYKNYSFVKLKKIEKTSLENNLEVNFQTSITLDKTKLNFSTLCLLISTNTRYEGSYLNLNLRQRLLKGNFKCFNLGSLLNLTFPINFLGTNITALNNMCEGNHLTCQDFKSSKYPIVVLNNEFYKRNDVDNILNTLKTLKHFDNITNIWRGINILLPSTNESNYYSLAKFTPLNSSALTKFSTLYFIGISPNLTQELKKLINFKILKCSANNYTSNFNQQYIIDQNRQKTPNINLLHYLKGITNFQNYKYLSTSNFYENQETFVTTEGIIKRTNKLLYNDKSRNHWQILRKLFKSSKLLCKFLNFKDNNLIFFNLIKIANFKNLVQFNYLAAKNLTNISFYLSKKTNSFFFNNPNYKLTFFKAIKSKFIYWIEDFYCGITDEYSYHSITIIRCFNILKLEVTNFF